MGKSPGTCRCDGGRGKCGEATGDIPGRENRTAGRFSRAPIRTRHSASVPRAPMPMHLMRSSRTQGGVGGSEAFLPRSPIPTARWCPAGRRVLASGIECRSPGMGHRVFGAVRLLATEVHTRRHDRADRPWPCAPAGLEIIRRGASSCSGVVDLSPGMVWPSVASCRLFGACRHRRSTCHVSAFSADRSGWSIGSGRVATPGRLSSKVDQSSLA